MAALFHRPVAVVIGVTGAGKSSLCNILCGIDPDDPNAPFSVSASINSCTYETVAQSRKWRGKGKLFTVVDTPGLGDATGRDTENIAKMAKQLKEIKSVNAFIIVFNAQNPRFDSSLLSMLKIFQGMFGPGYWKNVVIQFSRWSFSESERKKRVRKGVSEALQHREWNAKFREECGTTHDVPTVFLDSSYDWDSDVESSAFDQQAEKLFDIISNFDEFECKDIQAVLAERDQWKLETEKAVKDKEDADRQRKMAEENVKKEEAEKFAAQEEATRKARQVEEEKQRNLELERERNRAKDQAAAAKVEAAEGIRKMAEQSRIDKERDEERHRKELENREKRYEEKEERLLQRAEDAEKKRKEEMEALERRVKAMSTQSSPSDASSGSLYDITGLAGSLAHDQVGEIDANDSRIAFYLSFTEKLGKGVFLGLLRKATFNYIQRLSYIVVYGASSEVRQQLENAFNLNNTYMSLSILCDTLKRCDVSIASVRRREGHKFQDGRIMDMGSFMSDWVGFEITIL